VIWIIISVIFIYCIVGGSTAQLIATKYKDGNIDDGDTVAAGIFWPFALPVMLGLEVCKAIICKLQARQKNQEEWERTVLCDECRAKLKNGPYR